MFRFFQCLFIFIKGKYIRVWRTDTGELVEELFSKSKKQVKEIDFNHNNSYLIAVLMDNQICLFQLNDKIYELGKNIYQYLKE